MLHPQLNCGFLQVAGLEVDGLCHARLLERLAEGGVGMRGARNILGGGTVLQPEHGLGDHLTGTLNSKK
jgi:hypothetical protein